MDNEIIKEVLEERKVEVKKDTIYINKEASEEIKKANKMIEKIDEIKETLRKKHNYLVNLKEAYQDYKKNIQKISNTVKKEMDIYDDIVGLHIKGIEEYKDLFEEDDNDG